MVKDRNSNWMPAKQSKNRKIDGVAAVLTAHTFVIPMLIKPKATGKVMFYSVADLMNM